MTATAVMSFQYVVFVLQFFSAPNPRPIVLLVGRATTKISHLWFCSSGCYTLCVVCCIIIFAMSSLLNIYYLQHFRLDNCAIFGIVTNVWWKYANFVSAIGQIGICKRNSNEMSFEQYWCANGEEKYGNCLSFLKCWLKNMGWEHFQFADRINLSLVGDLCGWNYERGLYFGL